MLSIRVTTRSGRPGIGDWQADPGGRPFLEVRVAAAPTDGAANEEVVKLLANSLGVPKGSVNLVTGQSSRLKRLEVPLDDAEIRARLSR
jgi:uncharacterized protein YggU (UPF0235/DUF167 family)